MAVFAMAMRVSVDTDTWWHLQTGQIIVEGKIIPVTDSFSYTRAGEPWQYPSVGWVMQAGLYLIFNAFGFGGLNILQAVMVTSAFWIMYRTLSGGEFANAFVIILAVAVSGVFWAARPYLMSFLLTAITFWVLEDFRWRRKDRLWILPLLMILWSNSHGGFAIGLMLWGIYGLHEGVQWLGEARDGNALIPTKFSLEWLKIGMRGPVGRMLMIGALMLVGASVNREGAAVWLYPFQTVSIGVLRDFIQEWQSPNFHDLQMQPFAWLLLITLGAVGISKQKLALTDFLLVAGFGYLSLLAARNIAVFALVAPAVLSRHLESALGFLSQKIGFGINAGRNVPKIQSLLNWGIVASLGLVVAVRIYSVYPEEANREVYAQQVPVEAVAFLLSTQPDGQILNSYNWGGYLIWEAPEYPVFVDGRTDLYGDEIIIQWFQIVRADEGWQELLDQWDIQLILLEPDWPVVKLLANEGWEKLYQDDIAVIYAR